MRKFFIGRAVVFFIIVGLGLAYALVAKYADSHGTDPSPTAPPTSSPHAVGEPATAPSPSPTATPHPVSLQAVAARPLAGSDFTVGRVLDDNAAYTRHYITYKSGNFTISGVMNRPKGTGPFPILVLNHGYIDPAVYTNGRGLRREQDYLARQGFVVVHTDYRNHAESDDDPDNDVNFRLGYIDDAANAVDALRKSDLPYVDKERIGMLGHSMGGGVTQGVLTTKPDLVKAAVLFAPVSSSAKENFDRYTAERTGLAGEVTSIYGTPTTNPDFWKNVSFETLFANVKAPVMIHHGTADESTPLRWSESIASQLEANEKDVVLHVYPGEPHEFAAAWPTVMRRTTDFFKLHLG